MIANTIGLTADSYQSIYVSGGDEVAEVYGGINYADPIFYKSQTLTGSAPLYFDAYAEPLTDYTIFGNSYQDGVPSPEHPVEVQCVGEKTENLYNKLDADIIYEAYINLSGTIIPYTLFGTDLKVSGYIPVVPGENYKLIKAIVPNVTGAHCAFYDADKRYINSVPLLNDTTQTLTAPSNAYFFRTTVKHINVKDECMFVQYDVTPQSYIPYGYKIPITCGGVTQNIYLDEPLRKIGEYADKIDFKTGTIVRNIKKIVFDGTETFYKNVIRDIARFYYGIDNRGRNGSVYRSIFSHYIYGYDFTINHAYLTILGDQIWFNHPEATSLQDFISYVSNQYAAGTPVTVWYILATPITEQVTVPTLTPTTGNNTLSIGTILQPSEVSITGHIKPTGYGQLVDVNGVQILDKDNVPVFVHGQ